MREKLARFMQGRYGNDQLGQFLLVIVLILLVVEMITKNAIISIIGMLLLVVVYFRIFSRNITKRYQENQWFLNKTAGIRRAWAGWVSRLRQSKTHHIYKCPSCKQKIRVPRGKGRIEITCPKCGTHFIKKS